MSRIALITGATRGIGESIARALQNAGYTVAANYFSGDEKAQAFLKETGIPVFRWDVSNFDACQQGLEQVRAQVGQPEILINNAGITRDSMLHKMSFEQWHAVINTNLTSCFNMSRCVIESMREKGFGRIINISSINAQKGQLGQTNYCASKAGLIGFTKALALESASKGITVNAIAPGYTDTDMVRAIAPDIMTKIIAQIPVGRLGLTADIARTVLFLAADEASFITGATLSVNGGQYME